MKNIVLFTILKSRAFFSLKPSICIVRNESNSKLLTMPVTCADSNSPFSHTPVMPKEVLSALRPKDGGVFLDMTFGAGGHSQHLLETASIKLYCLDRDPVAYERAVTFAENYSGRVIPILGRFSEMDTLLTEAGVKKESFDGIFIDAGCSSMQMDDPKRGFSIRHNGYLDMRMDGNRYSNQPTAVDVLRNLSVPELAKIFKVYGEEKYAKKISQALFDARYLLKSINTTHELADIIYTVLGNEKRSDKLQRPAHVATKVFQALRIFVNNELNELNYGIDVAHSYLKLGGRLVTLTFHSLEDRIVKRHILGIDMDEPISHTMSQKYRNAAKWHVQDDLSKAFTNKWTPVYKHVVTPDEWEVLSNPRSRSAKLRAAIKVF